MFRRCEIELARWDKVGGDSEGGRRKDAERLGERVQVSGCATVVGGVFVVVARECDLSSVCAARKAAGPADEGAKAQQAWWVLRRTRWCGLVFTCDAGLNRSPILFFALFCAFFAALSLSNDGALLGPLQQSRRFTGEFRHVGLGR